MLRFLAEQNCKSKIVVLSGFRENYLEYADRLARAFGLSVTTLPKPFALNDLRDALRGD